MKTLIAVLIITGLTLGCSPSGNPNPKYADLQQPLSLNKQAVTVSGISSGGYMAHQYHIAFSDEVTGAALFASGPYGCAKNSLKTALQNNVNANLAAIQKHSRNKQRHMPIINNGLNSTQKKSPQWHNQSRLISNG